MDGHCLNSGLAKNVSLIQWFTALLEAFNRSHILSLVPPCDHDASPLRSRPSNPCYEVRSGRNPRHGPLHSRPDSEPTSRTATERKIARHQDALGNLQE